MVLLANLSVCFITVLEQEITTLVLPRRIVYYLALHGPPLFHLVHVTNGLVSTERFINTTKKYLKKCNKYNVCGVRNSHFPSNR